MMDLQNSDRVPRRYRWLPIVDAIVVFAAFQLAYLAVYEWQLFRPVQEAYRASFYGPYFGYYALFAAFLYVAQSGAALYRPVRGRSWAEEVYVILSAVTQGMLLLMALSFFLQTIVSSRQMLVYVAIASIILLSLGRALLRLVDARLRARGIGIVRTLLVGVGESGPGRHAHGAGAQGAGLSAGRLPARLARRRTVRNTLDFGRRIQSLGTLADLPRVLQEKSIQQVIYTLPLGKGERVRQVVAECRRVGVSFSVVPDVFQLNLRQVQVENLAGIPLLNLQRESAISGRNRLIKRALDISLITLTSPILLFSFRYRLVS